MCVVDLDGDGDLDVLGEFADDVITWHENRLLGDVNNDGIFNSSDLVRVFQAGEYEDGSQNNSTFEEGDWNGDGDFDSSDLVHVFRAVTYSAPAIRAAIVSQIESLFDAEDERHKKRRLGHSGLEGVLL